MKGGKEQTFSLFQPIHICKGLDYTRRNKNRPGYVLYPSLAHNDLQIILVTEILVHIDLNEAGIDLNASEGQIHWPMIPALFNSVSL